MLKMKSIWSWKAVSGSGTFDVRTTEGNIDLNIVSEGGSSASLNYTQIKPMSGDVSIVAGENITAASGTATITGNTVRLTLKAEPSVRHPRMCW